MVILGAEFLTKHRYVIDINRNLLQLGDYSLELIQRNGRLNVNCIVATEQTILKPHSVHFVRAELLAGNSRDPTEPVWVLEYRQLTPGIYVA